MAKEVKKKRRIGVSIQEGICFLFEGEGDPSQGTAKEIKSLDDVNAPIGSNYLDLVTGTMYVKKDTTPDLVGGFKVGEWINSAADGGIPEAPQDGKEYARKDGQWVEVIGQIPNAEYNVTGGIKMSRDSASSTTYVSFDGTDTPNVS